MLKFTRPIGFTKRPAGQLTGLQVWGDSYAGSEAGQVTLAGAPQVMGKWVKVKLNLWQKDQAGAYQPVTGDSGEQVQETGYIAQLGLEVKPLTQAANKPEGTVLGTSDAATTSSSLDWVEIASQSGELTQEKIRQLNLAAQAQQQAVVNRAVLQVLGLSEAEAIGKKFEASFIVMGKALDQKGEKVESVPAEYEIVAIIPGDQVPLFYVPFMDLRSLGIVNYDQVKLVSTNQVTLPQARQKVEAMGYVTRSVVDTVEQIKSIFVTTRTVLAFLGMAALIVASLGMFNTLTVSLLERTREVGLMKALGMKATEVKELFLIESLSMGLLGGIMGIVLGFSAGKLLSVALSVFSVVKGVGLIDVSLVPLIFVFLVLFLAILVGILTGLYPAKRATKISALNALRYE